ncbi:MAG: hypothetical protein JWR11_3533 [Mycobacterium sp.]|nr:hypothetical protein [Mycobacterium sp.]MDT5064050.1 hypothetical protein [Mycobacterium sp.]MDT5179705.1 hypothetical protein [Mycobacterium sp.]
MSSPCMDASEAGPTMGCQPNRPRSTGRIGFLSLLLPGDTSADDAPALLRRLVVSSLAKSGESLARLKIDAGARSRQGPMERWFVEYETVAPAAELFSAFT